MNMRRRWSGSGTTPISWQSWTFCPACDVTAGSDILGWQTAPPEAVQASDFARKRAPCRPGRLRQSPHLAGDDPGQSSCRAEGWGGLPAAGGSMHRDVLRSSD